ncbi:hypothetical protein GOBAR_DD20242 [Gossypium barbadense]|nr:hypothetical protein GOBAR_DD20242 [Gossypium barbadense]
MEIVTGDVEGRKDAPPLGDVGRATRKVRKRAAKPSIDANSLPDQWHTSMRVMNDDIELVAGDVIIEEVDDVSSIQFLDYVHSLVEKNMAQIVIVKLFVEYGCLPLICSHCGIYGHLKEVCLKCVVMDESTGTTASTKLREEEQVHPFKKDNYGP